MFFQQFRQLGNVRRHLGPFLSDRCRALGLSLISCGSILGNDLFRFANFVVEAVKGAGSTKPTTHWKAWAFSGISFCMITRIRPAAQTPAERAASANGSITALHRRRRRSGSLAMLAAMRSASSRGRLRPHPEVAHSSDRDQSFQAMASPDTPSPSQKPSLRQQTQEPPSASAALKPSSSYLS